MAASKTGIYVSESIHTDIANNAVGTDNAWSRNLANTYSGITFDYYARDNTVADNRVGYGSRAGIFVFGAGSVRNRLTRNEISGNEQRGIENAFGGNSGILPPTIMSVTTSSVSGKAGSGNIVEVFADDSSQGRYFRGTAVANASGAFTLPLSNPIIQRYATATATDSAGNTSEFSAPYPISTVDVRLENTTPAGFDLIQNYPNPFNPSTTIRFQIPGFGSQTPGSGTRDQGSSAGNPAPGIRTVRLSVYDLLGREVAVLVNERKDPGTYVAEFNAVGLGTGVFFYRLTAGTYSATKKMIMVK